MLKAYGVCAREWWQPYPVRQKFRCHRNGCLGCLTKMKLLEVDLDWEAVTDALVKSLRDTLSLLRTEHLPLPMDYQFEPDNPNRSSQAQWLKWLFVRSINNFNPVWQKAWECLQQDSQDKAEAAGSTLKHCLKVMSVLADPNAVADKMSNQEWRDKLPEISATLPRIIKQYIELADELAGYLPNQFEQFTQL